MARLPPSAVRHLCCGISATRTATGSSW
jgi:hypothetical protein